MPFDTTYVTPTRNGKIEVKHPGGEDITIFLQPGELPPGMDPVTQQLVDSLVNNTQDRTYEPGPPIEHKDVPIGDILFWLAAIAIGAALFYRLAQRRTKSKIQEFIFGDSDEEEKEPVQKPRRNYLTYYGDELGFSEKIIVTALTKYFGYYNKLDPFAKQRFVRRLKTFMESKTFLIHHGKGFSEMPILISACAIQLTFGLEKYLLPHYSRIHIYPEEYVAASTLHIIEGNVQGNTINFSWKHFLNGYQEPADGQNVGLHEMSHALYAQNFLLDENVDDNFEDYYHEFNSIGRNIYDSECSCATPLYSDYARTSFQEFWAESVEIFFEKPTAMKAQYPQLYSTIKEILNQDPIAIGS